MFRLDKQALRSIVILLVVAGALWVGFAPVQLGGPVSYVIVSGNSMEPAIELGDLVVARRASVYEIDQAVVYQHPQIGFVYHRIVGQEGEAFILQGDNNDWLDSYQPTESEILGKHWFLIPGAGNLIRKLRQPVNFSAFLFIIIIIAAGLFLFQKQDQIRKKIRGSVKTMNTNQPLSSGDTRQELLLFIAVLAAVSLIFSVIAFAKPLTRVISDDLVYFHQGSFTYTAPDPENVYDSDQIETGEPIYLQLTCEMQMAFAYQLIPAGEQLTDISDLSAAYQVEAVISDVDGWKRTYNLIPETSLKGTAVESEMAFDICQAQALILDKEEKTAARNRWYDLTIYPRVVISGTIDDLRVEDVYQPAIAFQMDANILRMPDGTDASQLSQEGRVSDTRVVNNTMQIFGQQINVVLARRIGVISLVFCSLAAVLPAWSLFKDWRASDVSRIQVQYHPLLVDVQEGAIAVEAEQVVDVASFTDLTKMAERYGAMILHERRGSYHRYSVQDEQVVYQYILDSARGESLFPDAYAFKRSLRTGLAEDQFELYYQPVIAVKDRQVLGVEAFLRWNHPQLGTIYPADFIQQAENGNLIPEIDSWVVHQVCRQLGEWQEAEVPVVPVSINLSPGTVVNEDFIQDFQQIFLEEVCQPELIQVEINRSNQVFQDKRFQDHLAKLAELGITLAIDNFATDDANQINQVFQAPIQTLKIDRAIVQKMDTDSHAKQLVGAVVAMGHKFQVQVVAQGVETEQYLELIKAQDVEVAQGFYFGKPIRPEELEELLGSKQKKNRFRKW